MSPRAVVGLSGGWPRFAAQIHREEVTFVLLMDTVSPPQVALIKRGF